MIEESLKKLIAGENLSREEMHGIFSQMMEGGISDTQKSALLVALRMKGETAEEITGAALAMRERGRGSRNTGTGQSHRRAEAPTSWRLSE